MHHLLKIFPASLILLFVMWLAPQAASAQDAKPVGVRLKQIVLPEVVFDGLPLPEMAKILTSDSKKHDPNKQGVQIEAGTLATTIISIKQMKNATLDDVLKAIVKGTSPAIAYRVQGDKVVFAAAAAKATSIPPKKK